MRGEHPTLDGLLDKVKDSGGRKTLYKILRIAGFLFCKVESGTYLLMERDDVNSSM